MQGLALLLDISFWEQYGFQISIFARVMSWNAKTRLWWFSMIDRGVFSNNMKSPSPEGYMRLWGTTIYCDTLRRSETPTHDLFTLLAFVTEFTFPFLFLWQCIASKSRKIVRKTKVLLNKSNVRSVLLYTSGGNLGSNREWVIGFGRRILGER